MPSMVHFSLRIQPASKLATWWPLTTPPITVLRRMPPPTSGMSSGRWCLTGAGLNCRVHRCVQILMDVYHTKIGTQWLTCFLKQCHDRPYNTYESLTCEWHTITNTRHNFNPCSAWSEMICDARCIWENPASTVPIAYHCSKRCITKTCYTDEHGPNYICSNTNLIYHTKPRYVYVLLQQWRNTVWTRSLFTRSTE